MFLVIGSFGSLVEDEYETLNTRSRGTSTERRPTSGSRFGRSRGRYPEHEGVSLDHEGTKKAPGLRTVVLARIVLP
jgi:hypothetical protein